MKIGIIVAMHEEFKPIDTLLSNFLVSEHQDTYNIKEYNYKSINIVTIVSKIGKAAAASATTVLINNYNCDLIINFGSCGAATTEAQVHSFIFSNACGYYDVDVSAFGYKKGQMAQQTEFFTSQNIVFNFFDCLSFVKKNNPDSIIKEGFVISGDSFINESKTVEKIAQLYENTLGIDMEAAAIGQICNLYKKDFIIIKKITDGANEDASKSFKNNILNMEQQSVLVIQELLNYVAVK